MKSQSKNIRNFIWYGIYYEIATALYKPFSAKFVERLGGSEWHISLLSSLPGLMMLLAVVSGTLFIRNIRNQKKVTMVQIAAGRLVILLFAAVPFLPIGIRPMVFVMLFALMSYPLGIYQVSYQSYLGDAIRPAERAVAIGLRNKYAILATMITTLLTGLALSRLPSTDGGRLALYQLFFVLAFIIGMIELISFGRLDNAMSEIKEKEKLLPALKNIFKDRTFTPFLWASLAFHFGWQMGWPLFSIYQIKVLGATETWLSVLAVVSGLSMSYFQKFWIGQIERNGSAKVNAFATLGMALTPILFLMSKTLYVLTFVSAITGFFTSGTITVLMHSLLEVVPERRRTLYMGVYNTFINLSLAVSPLIGHAFLANFGMGIALMITAFFRLIGSYAFHLRRKFI